MIKQYEDELEALKKKMIRAEKFAERIPYFRQFILDKKLDGTEEGVTFATSYKRISFYWDLYRMRFNSVTNRIANYEGNYDKHLFRLHLNTLTLYDSHEKFGLEKILEKSNVFFFDGWNTTFYIEDEHIEEFLEALNAWYVEALAQLNQHRKDEEIRTLENKLAKLKEHMNKKE